MPNSKLKKDLQKADLIAIGAIKYDEESGEIEKFKSLIKPIMSTNIFPHIEELTQIKTQDLIDAPSYESVMRDFKKWMGLYSEIEGIYTFGNLDFTCLNNTDKISSQKYNHPRFVNNIKNLFVDIKDKYIDKGIKCMNYISLKNLINFANIEFSGEAHDPLNDAYNLYVLDEILENDKDIRDLLTMWDIIKLPFTSINPELEDNFEKYKNYFYNNEGNYNIDEFSIEIIKTVNMYVNSLKEMDINNIEVLRDISRKLDTIDKIKDIEEGYFYMLENLYFDLDDLLEDLMLYKLGYSEFIDEIDNILDLFNEDLIKENITIEILLKESC
jgi:inhibitor of KinA sporulation pathway (predicted exonuclease)